MLLLQQSCWIWLLLTQWMNESFIYSGKVNWVKALFFNDALCTKHMKTHIQYDHKLQFQTDCRTLNNRHLNLSKEIRWFSSRAPCKSFQFWGGKILKGSQGKYHPHLLIQWYYRRNQGAAQRDPHYHKYKTKVIKAKWSCLVVGFTIIYNTVNSQVELLRDLQSLAITWGDEK